MITHGMKQKEIRDITRCRFGLNLVILIIFSKTPTLNPFTIPCALCASHYLWQSPIRAKGARSTSPHHFFLVFQIYILSFLAPPPPVKGEGEKTLSWPRLGQTHAQREFTSSRRPDAIVFCSVVCWLKRRLLRYDYYYY